MRLSRKAVLAAGLLVVPFVASAESNFVSTGSANAKLDFRIVIPRVIYLRVGSGTAMADDPTVDTITFDVPAATLGNGTPVNATAASGDLGNGAVTARVFGNNGTVALNATTGGPLGKGAGDTISYSTILTTASVLSTPIMLDAPTLADGVSGTVTLTPATGKIVNRDARWTYTYQNSVMVEEGLYGTTNGTVTYTAAMP
ncbi:MAG TPA: hypothetical protein VEY50_00515 [Lysobacter sp.]|nr:hypothetical protein [Lysobacter sp.]